MMKINVPKDGIIRDTKTLKTRGQKQCVSDAQEKQQSSHTSGSGV